MTVRDVVRLPEAVLRYPCATVTQFDAYARQLSEDLVDTMRVSPGCVGLAASQIGVPLRAFCVDITGHKKANSCNGLVVMFNPEIVEASSFEVGREGCMSVPDFTGDVERATQIVVRGCDAKGVSFEVAADAFEAKAFQHEIDHLNGYLFIDRIAPSGGIFPRKVYR